MMDRYRVKIAAHGAIQSNCPMKWISITILFFLVISTVLSTLSPLGIEGKKRYMHGFQKVLDGYGSKSILYIGIPSTYQQIVIDGNISDWSDVPIGYRDYLYDCSAGMDIDTVYFAHDINNIYIAIKFLPTIINNSSRFGFEILYGTLRNESTYIPSIYPNQSIGTHALPGIYEHGVLLWVDGSQEGFDLYAEGTWIRSNNSQTLKNVTFKFNLTSNTMEVGLGLNQSKEYYFAIISVIYINGTYSECDIIPQSCDISTLYYKREKFTKAIELPYTIQTISVDGDLSDWMRFGINPIYQDEQEYEGMGGVEGTYDIVALWVAHDMQYAYFALELSGNLNSAVNDPNLNGAIGFFFSAGNASQNEGAIRISGTANPDIGTDDLSFGYTYGIVWLDMFPTWLSRTWIDVEGNFHNQINYYAGKDLFAYHGNVFELKIPLFGVGGLNLSDYGEKIAFGVGTAKNIGGLTEYMDIDVCPNNISTYYFEYTFVKGETISLEGAFREDIVIDGDAEEWTAGWYNVINTSIYINGTDLDVNAIYIANNNTHLLIDFNITPLIPMVSTYGSIFLNITVPYVFLESIDEYWAMSILQWNNHDFTLAMEYTHKLYICLLVTYNENNSTLQSKVIESKVGYVDKNGIPCSQEVYINVSIGNANIEVALPIYNPYEKYVAKSLILWIFAKIGDNEILVPFDPTTNYITYSFIVMVEHAKGNRSVYLPSQFRHIELDGDLSDWNDSFVYYDDLEYEDWQQDENGDGNVDIFGKDIDPRYVDIKSVRFAHDLERLYIAIEFAGNIEETILEKEVGFALVCNAPQSSPYWNASPPLVPIPYTPEYPYIPDSKRMIDTGDLGFDLGYIFAWFSVYAEFTNLRGNHVRKFYQSLPYFTQVETYSYRVAAVKNNVVEMGIPLFEHGLDLNTYNFTLKASLFSFILESTVQPWNLDACPYDNGRNTTPGSKYDDMCMYFVYNIKVDKRDILTEQYNRYHEDCTIKLERIGTLIKRKDIITEYENVLSEIEQRWENISSYPNQDSLDSVDVVWEMESIVLSISTLDALINVTYETMEYEEIITRIAPWFDLQTEIIATIWSDVEIIAENINKDISYAKRRLDGVSDALSYIYNEIYSKVPPVKIAIYDSEGTNIYNEKVWGTILNNQSMYGPIPIDIDHVSLDHENITLQDILSTNASVIVIDNAASKGRKEILSPGEIMDVKRYIAEYGGGAVGIGNTLATAYVPEHKDLMVVFGLDANRDVYASVPVSHKMVFVYDDPLLMYRIGLKDYVSAFHIGVGAFELNATRGSYAAKSEKNDTAVIVGRYGASDNIYITLPISDKKPYGSTANYQDMQMLYNALIYASGIYTIFDLYQMVVDMFGTVPISVIENIKVDMKHGRYHEARRDLIEYIRTNFTVVFEGYIAQVTECLKTLHDLGSDDYRVWSYEFETFLSRFKYLSNLSSPYFDVMYHDWYKVYDDAYMAMTDIKDMLSRISEATEFGERELNMRIDMLYSMIQEIAEYGINVKHIKARINSAITLYYNEEYLNARVRCDEIETMIIDLYYQVKSNIYSEIRTIKGNNMLYDVSKSEDLIKKAEDAFEDGNTSLAFKYLVDAKNSIVPGVPYIIPVITVLFLVILFMVLSIARGKSTPAISVGTMVETYYKKHKPVNMGIINSSSKDLDESIFLDLCKVSRKYNRNLLAVIDSKIYKGIQKAVRDHSYGAIVVGHKRKYKQGVKIKKTGEVEVVYLNPMADKVEIFHDIPVMISKLLVNSKNRPLIYMNISRYIDKKDPVDVRPMLKYLIDRTHNLKYDIVVVLDARYTTLDNAYLYALELSDTYKVTDIPKESIFKYISQNRIKDYINIMKFGYNAMIRTEKMGNQILKEGSKVTFMLKTWYTHGKEPGIKGV